MLFRKNKHRYGWSNREPTDFTEIHSAVLELLLMEKEVLKRITCHYTYQNPELAAKWKSEHGSLPPKMIPEDQLDLFVRSRNLDALYNNTSSL